MFGEGGGWFEIENLEPVNGQYAKLCATNEVWTDEIFHKLLKAIEDGKLYNPELLLFQYTPKDTYDEEIFR